MIQLLSHRFFSFALVSYEINFGWLYFKLFLSLNTEQYLYQIQIYRKDVTLTFWILCEIRFVQYYDYFRGGGGGGLGAPEA
jgi:hypothetical protein